MQRFREIYNQTSKQKRNWKTLIIKTILCRFNIWTKELKVIKLKNKNLCEKTTRKRTITTNCTIQILNQIFSKISQTQKN